MNPSLLLIGLAQAAAGEPAAPPIYRQRSCDVDRQDGDVVVCGRRGDQEKYRLPGTGRSRSSSWRESHSWGAIMSEEEQRSRYGSQTVGPFGYLQYGQQQVREWRLEREQMAKTKRDETRRIDEAATRPEPD